MYYSWLVGQTRLNRVKRVFMLGVSLQIWGRPNLAPLKGFHFLRIYISVLGSWLDEAEVFSNHDNDIFGVALMFNQEPIMHTLTKGLEVLINLTILEAHHYSLWVGSLDQLLRCRELGKWTIASLSLCRYLGKWFMTKPPIPLPFRIDQNGSSVYRDVMNYKRENTIQVLTLLRQ